MLVLKYQDDTRDWALTDRESATTVAIVSDAEAAERIGRLEELAMLLKESRIGEQIRASHRRQEIDICETTVDRLAELIEGL